MANYTEQFASAFEVRTRDDGSKFVALKDDAPEWASNIVYSAHDGAMPCDWRYSKIDMLAHDLLDAFANDYEFDAIEWADNTADIYNHHLLNWVAGVSYAVDAVEDARAEWGADGANGFLEWVRAGQVYMLHQMACFVEYELRELSEQIEAA
jgi:hypothetical protein